MKLNFGQDVLVLPGAVLSVCEEADAPSLRVLLWLASDLSLAEKPRQLSKLTGCSESAVKKAIALWKRAGILSEDGAAVETMATSAAAEEKSAPRKLLKPADTLPTYTMDELAALIEERQGMRELIDAAQQTMGMMFRPVEINILVGMVDYLQMDEDCILLLLAHCRKMGKKSMRAIEKYAYSLVDAGITDAEALEEHIRESELLHTLEGEVRTMFGLKSRALTSKEGKMLTEWLSFGYGSDVIRRAYEITVSSTDKASIPYAHAILTRWHSEGLRTAEEIDAQLAKDAEQKNKPTEPTLGNSFDTYDFFDAALRRAYDDMGIGDDMRKD